MADSVFTKIIKGEIPCQKLYEDSLTIAFLTIRPAQPGHALVVSKKQIDHLWDLPNEDYLALMATTKKVAQKMRQTLGVKRVGLKVIGEEVPHAHIHLIPFDTLEEYDSQPIDATPEALEEMAKKLAF